MIRHVSLDHLPDGWHVPEDLHRRLAYDPQHRQLSFEGFMSKATFDRLYRLTEDRAYRHALEQLFQMCTFDEAGTGHGLWQWLSHLFRRYRSPWSASAR